MCSRFFIVVLSHTPPLPPSLPHPSLSISVFSLSTPLPNLQPHPPFGRKGREKKSRWEVDNKMLKKRSSVCMKQVLIPPYCRMCVAAAREESLMCFPSPPSPTASKPWLLLRHKNYIVVSSATKAGLPCELSPSLSPFASCAFSVLAFVFRFFLSILWDFFVPSPCKQCRDDAGYPRFSAELR